MQGLSSIQAKKFLLEFGLNVIKTAPKTSALKIFLSQFSSPLILILIFASAISALAGEITDTIIIGLVLIFNSCVGFYQEYKAEKSLEALKKMVPYRTRVYRDGRVIEIDSQELVPGDVIEISEGEKVPADGVVLQSFGYKFDESAMTGESLPVSKEKNDEVFMGTVVSYGRGLIKIEKTGMKTKFGEIARITVETPDDPSPLQEELSHIGKWISRLVVALSILIFVILVVKNGTQNSLHYLIYATSLAVAAVPESLPTTLTITLTRGAKTLARKHSLIRKLNAMETLGSVSVICTDKTGTLTQNRMTVVRAWTPQSKEIDLSKNKNKPDDNLKKIIEIGALCTEAHLQKDGDVLRMLGDPTEGCLLVLGEKYNLPQNAYQSKNPLVYSLAFDSDRKRMTTIHKQGKNYNALTKGSPDSVLKTCNYILENDKVKKLTPKMRAEILQSVETQARRALRVLGFAYRSCTASEIKKPTINSIENEMIFVGLTGIIDPPREDVPAAIKEALRAGIRIFMVTGDSPITAEAIALQVGLVQKGAYQTHTGAEIEAMTDAKLNSIITNKKITPIFARVAPTDKSRIVRLTKISGERVATTGDGVNDAPALKTADIGIAMGISGTDVAKEASNMVLLNDNFAAIITAVREGRHIYANMQKFIYYNFSTNTGEMVLVTLAALFGLAQPLTPALILVINLITDLLPALALGYEPVEKDVMAMPPRAKKHRIFNRDFVTRFAIVGTIIGLGTLGMFVVRGGESVWQSHLAPAYAMVSTFALLVAFELFNAFNSKSLEETVLSKKLFDNKFLWVATLGGFAIIFALINLPWSQGALKITNLSLGDWGWILLIGSTVFVVEEIFKYFRRKRHEVY